MDLEIDRRSGDSEDEAEAEARLGSAAAWNCEGERRVSGAKRMWWMVVAGWIIMKVCSRCFVLLFQDGRADDGNSGLSAGYVV